jgi:pyrroloquinoline quinone biosynthesis protein D
MSELASDHALRLAPGCRLSTAKGQQDVLLIPEGALRLKGPAQAIVELCDGKRMLGEIVQELKHLYPLADAVRIETETVAFLTQMRDRGVIEEL